MTSPSTLGKFFRCSRYNFYVKVHFVREIFSGFPVVIADKPFSRRRGHEHTSTLLVLVYDTSTAGIGRRVVPHIIRTHSDLTSKEYLTL